MTPDKAVALYVQQQPKTTRYCVAFSGGMDSHLLLHLMVQLRQEDDTIQLRAVHVDHALQEASAAWAEHARHICDELSVPLDVRRADVSAARDDGPEASARLARYAQFSAILEPDEHLLLAQHAEDQAETFLLQALRGSGPDGLSGIPRKRRFSNGIMARPLLSCSQESLHEAAQQLALDWIEDPSNQDQKYDRNYLRLTIMPLLKARWPAASQTLGRAAQRSAAASQTLLGLAQEDLNCVKIPGTTELSVTALAELPRERAFTTLRLFVRQRGLRMPRLQDLTHVMTDLIEARADSSGIVNVRDYVFRRYRDNLYVLPPLEEVLPFHYTWSEPFAPLTIQETGLTLTTDLCLEQGIRLPVSGSVTVKSRAGGELIKVGKPVFHKSVKKILQESAVPPWTRDTIPLLYIDDSLAAIWNIEVSVDFRQRGVISLGDAASAPLSRSPTTHSSV